MRILSIDQGTTNTKAVLIDQDGTLIARSSAPLTTSYPKPGWVEQSADDIWQSVKSVINEIARAHGADQIDALAIANQRETWVCWDAMSSKPIMPAIVWQCRRNADACADLVAAGHAPTIEQATGLGINPLFPASKFGWVMQNVPQAKSLAAKGDLRAGTVDAWLLWKLTNGQSFATDHSNASRTLLFDTETLTFSEELCAIFDVPRAALPAPMASNAEFGQTAKDTTDLRAGVPIRAMMGDSHAALYGHGIRQPGAVKATYGTGSSLMTLTAGRILSQNGVSATLAWTDSAGTVYALEGNILVSAQAAAFMAQMLDIDDVEVLSALAQTVPDSGGVSFVPALAGLGAPHWSDDATGLISGMTHATTRAHLARATMEAIAMQICDVFEAMQKDAGQPLQALRADGGASANPFLMQLQADLLAKPVMRADIPEIGAVGAAAMALKGLGHAFAENAFAGSQDFTPNMDQQARQKARDAWAATIKRCTA